LQTDQQCSQCTEQDGDDQIDLKTHAHSVSSLRVLAAKTPGFAGAEKKTESFGVDIILAMTDILATGC